MPIRSGIGTADQTVSQCECYPNFVAAEPIPALRGTFVDSGNLTRRRRTLVGDGVAEKNRIQKVLEDANVKIGNVLSDVFGTSGQAMLEALLEKKRSAAEIAELRPIAELCSGEQAHLFVRGLTLMDAILRQQDEAQQFLAGDLEAELAACGVDAFAQAGDISLKVAAEFSFHSVRSS